jgi:hypothetical protein
METEPMANPTKSLLATEQAAARLEQAAERITDALLRVEARMLAAAELLARQDVAEQATKPAKVS